VTSILFGATTAAQIEENLTAFEAVEAIDESLIERLHNLFPADAGFFG
jgi:aryl-alcohol dehydrogenase-like predicted oxidoreductase